MSSSNNSNDISGKKLSLLFSDIVNSQFSPKGVFSPSSSTTVAKTGKTPKALTFEMFGSRQFFYRDDINPSFSSPSNSIATSDTTSHTTADSNIKNILSITEDDQVLKKSEMKKKRNREENSDEELYNEYDDEEHKSVEGSDDEIKPSNTPSSSSEVCPYFLKGGCRFRKNCRLNHSIGTNCPYCSELLPTTWTQQSKHLKKCYEGQVDQEELMNSMDISCQRCGIDVVNHSRMFGLLNNCIHALCLNCVEDCWDFKRQCIECPICKKSSTVVIQRDRIYFDSDRKAKMFGIYMKKLENLKKKQQHQQQHKYHLQQQQLQHHPSKHPRNF